MTVVLWKGFYLTFSLGNNRDCTKGTGLGQNYFCTSPNNPFALISTNNNQGLINT